MKSIAYFLAFLSVFSAALAVDVQKQVIVTYEENTPGWVIDQAKNAIIESGGIITHEFKLLIKGFSAKVGEKVLDSVQTMGTQYKVTIEEDQVVTSS